MRYVTLLVVLLAGTAVADTLEGATWSASGPVENGLRLLSGSDGVTATVERDGSPCATTAEGATPPSAYLYFDVDNARAADLTGPLYVVVEYYGGGIGGVLNIQYDSNTGDGTPDVYRPNERQWGGWLVGDKGWKKGVFLFEKPRLAGRQNLGADFRLGGAPAFVRSVTLTHTLPADAEELDKQSLAALEVKVHIGEGGQLIIGGFDPVKRDDTTTAAALEKALPGMKALGVTSHEGYVRWNLCEPEPGKYDWSVYDRFAEVYKKYDVKWVPFLIIGSAYSLPDWYYKQPGSQGYVCLEHGEESDVQSLWNPVLREHVARFIKAFCEHYGPTGVIESILLGITGNYGEAIYPVSGNDWTADVHGNYHSHPDMWAGDPFAVADFRKTLTAKYTTVEALNKAWGTALTSFEEVKPFRRKQAPNDRAWLDFCHWYIGSMTDYTQFWLRETRNGFPKGDINVCTGGHAPAEHGSDFGEQCRIAAELGCGVRITNEASNYAANFSLTRWVASAGRQYGAYYSFEPAGLVTPEGVPARVYNATASGAKGLHYYYGNIFDNQQASDNFVKWGGEFKQRDPKVEIYVYYPETAILLTKNDFLERLQPLRDRFDFGYQSDKQILDGGLEQAKALVLLHGSVSEAPVWDAIVQYVRDGGLVLYADGIGRLHTVEGDEAAHEALFGAAKDLGKGRVLTFAGDPNSEDYRAFLSAELAKAPELSADTRAMVAADGKPDKVYVTLSSTNELLWFSQAEAGATLPNGATLAPNAITTTRVAP
ncbi:MAG: beta-galactosidase [FCB group bacterium]|jgi:hypothetical protein|nr:beta-galactosidase [FCB group bacterium]